MKRLLTILVILTSLFMFSSVYAGISITPAKFTIRQNVSDTFSYFITVNNPNNYTINVDISHDFSPDDFTAVLDPLTMTLVPNETKHINYWITSLVAGNFSNTITLLTDEDIPVEFGISVTSYITGEGTTTSTTTTTTVPPAPTTTVQQGGGGGGGGGGSHTTTTTIKACTMEAKICPDGSAVGRVLPNCDFALCPNATVLKQMSADLLNITPNEITLHGNMSSSFIGHADINNNNDYAVNITLSMENNLESSLKESMNQQITPHTSLHFVYEFLPTEVGNFSDALHVTFSWFNSNGIKTVYTLPQNISIVVEGQQPNAGTVSFYNIYISIGVIIILLVVISYYFIRKRRAENVGKDKIKKGF